MDITFNSPVNNKSTEPHGVMSGKRFAGRTEQEIENLIRSKDSSSTKKATKQAVKILREFCSEKEIPTNFENLTKTQLNELLRNFYANERKADGSFYTKNTLNAIRYGLSRYLMAEKKVSIIDDVEFGSSNQVFFGVYSGTQNDWPSKGEPSS